MQSQSPVYKIKKRPFWNCRAYQLFREESASQYVKNALPESIDGIRIVVPEIRTQLNLSGVTIQSQKILGKTLLQAVYEPNSAEYVISYGLAALQALWSAHVKMASFPFFSRVYRPYRIMKLALCEINHQNILSSRDFWCLFHRFIKKSHSLKCPPVLVHGNLHGGNIIVNYQENLLGLVDFELVHIGSPVTDFVPLWITYYFASPRLSQKLIHEAMLRWPDVVNSGFLNDAVLEVALESYMLVRKGRRYQNEKLENLSTTLLMKTLSSNDLREL